MSAEIISLNGKSVVVGLDWDLLNVKSNERKAVREMMKKNPGVKAGVVVNGTTRSVIGMMGVGQKRPSAPSGAAILAFVNGQELAAANGRQSSSVEETNWVVIQKLPDSEDRYWLVEIREELPMPATDKIYSLEEVRNHLEASLAGEDTLNLRIYTKDDEIFTIIPAGFKHWPESAFDLIEKWNKPSKANLKNLSGIDPVVFSVVGAGILLIAGYTGWNYYQDTVKKKMMSQQAAAQEKERIEQNEKTKQQYLAEVEKNALQALDQAVEAVNKGLATAHPAEVMQSWVELVESVPLNHSGWDTTGVECSMETPQIPICKISMKKGSYSTIRILKDDYPGVEIEGDAASYSLRGSELKLRTADWNGMESRDEFASSLISDLQYFTHGGVNFNQGASQEITQQITLPPPPTLIDQAQAEAGTQKPPEPGIVNTGVALGQLAISGSNVWRFKGMSESLERQGLTVNSMSITINSTGDMGWTLQSEFLIRSLPSPVIPTIVTPHGNVTVKLPEKYKNLVSGKEAQGGIGSTTGVATVVKPRSENQQGSGERAVDGQPAASSNAPPPNSFSLGLPDSTEAESN